VITQQPDRVATCFGWTRVSGVSI